MRNYVITILASALIGAGAGNSLAVSSKADVYEKLDTQHAEYVAISPKGSCVESADGGIIGAVGIETLNADGGVKSHTCWETRARVCVPSKIAGIPPECEEYVAPTDADVVPTIIALVKGRVLPGVASKHGFALATP